MINEMVIPSEEEMDQLSVRGWAIYQEKIETAFEPQENGKVMTNENSPQQAAVYLKEGGVTHRN